jgi:glycosyltransferase involved in cell wall biosynthesis
MANIAIILPAYNEELTIGDTIRAFHSALPHAEIWVVNNNSTDNTERIAEAVFDESGGGKIIRERRQGKGNAVRCAFHKIDADVYVLADADLTYPADQILDLIAPVMNGEADMVVGDRRSKGNYSRENKRLFHNFGNRLVQMLVNKLFSASLADIMSGYRAFNKRFIKNYPILVDGFELETDMTLYALHNRFRIMEIPVEYIDRPASSFSKLNTVRDGFRVLNTIQKIFRHYRPLAFFGISSCVFFLAGLLCGLPPVLDYMRYQYVYHIPLSILSIGLIIAGIVLGAIGLILDSIAYQNRLLVERDLLKF